MKSTEVISELSLQLLNLQILFAVQNIWSEEKWKKL